MNVNVPVIIVGFSLNGLGIVRSLAPLGVKCFILFNEAEDPCIKTKYGEKIRVGGISAEEILPAGKKVKDTTGEKPVMFLTNDFTVDSVSRHRHLFEELVRFPLPDHDMVDALLKKSKS
jgi:predicted ATP-grasp superfamily ATP-dependent carboligase